MARMSELMQDHNIPQLTLGWRLKMALGPMHANEMADALDISRTTISRWMSDRGTAPKVYVRQWALITRTDPGWLLTGRQTSSPPFDSPGDKGDQTRASGHTVGYSDWPLTLVAAA